MVGALRPVFTLTVESATGRSHSFAAFATQPMLVASVRRSIEATDVA